MTLEPDRVVFLLLLRDLSINLCNLPIRNSNTEKPSTDGTWTSLSWQQPQFLPLTPIIRRSHIPPAILIRLHLGQPLPT